jgi:hypothetical protein
VSKSHTKTTKVEKSAGRLTLNCDQTTSTIGLLAGHTSQADAGESEVLWHSKCPSLKLHLLQIGRSNFRRPVQKTQIKIIGVATMINTTVQPYAQAPVMNAASATTCKTISWDLHTKFN